MGCVACHVACTSTLEQLCASRVEVGLVIYNQALLSHSAGLWLAVPNGLAQGICTLNWAHHIQQPAIAIPSFLQHLLPQLDLHQRTSSCIGRALELHWTATCPG